MKTKFLNLLFAGLFISGVVLTGCSKNEAIDDLNNNAKTVSDEPGDGHTVGLKLLNQDLVVYYATDGAVNITQQFNSYVFRFAGTEPSGQAYAWDKQVMQSGSWTMDASGNLAISYPTTSPQLVFMNRTWKNEGSSSAVIRLVAPDGDEVQLAAKP